MAALRGSCPFRYGDTIDFGDPLSVTIAGCCPINDVERRYVHERGLEAFWDLEWDLYDVRRSRSV